MATVVTTMPMWLALWTRIGGERVPLTSWIGLGLGVGGAVLLSLEGDFSANWIGALAAFGAPLCWSLGSYASRRLDLPGPAMASAAEWLMGGARALAVAAWLEPVAGMFNASATAWMAWTTCWCLALLHSMPICGCCRDTTAALAGRYSFVLAVALGGLVSATSSGWVFARCR
jgi:drug/metabolite transporter (DMT)-like permease